MGTFGSGGFGDAGGSLAAPGRTAANQTASSFWDIGALKMAPKAEVVGESVEKTQGGDVALKEIRYESPAQAGKTLSIFAYYAYPIAKRNTRLPAIVWVHGGGSTASKEAVLKWASLGYVSIAMDLPGKGGEAREGSRSEGPDMSDALIFKVSPSPRESYLYLCVNAVCRAISFLGEQREVDRSRIGVLGYSWGGVITLLANGIDDRVSAACTVFGAGHIPDESIWVQGQLSSLSAKDKKLWRDYFDPSSYLASQHGKTLFASATGDIYFPLRSFVKTYNGAACEKAMCLTLDKNHELDETCSRNIERWFDYALKSGSPFPRLKTKRERDTIKVWAHGARPAVGVSLATTTADDFAGATWDSTSLEERDEVWTAPAPKPGAASFVTVIDDNGVLVAGDVILPPRAR